MTYTCGFSEREVGLGGNSEIAKGKMLGVFFLPSIIHVTIDLLKPPLLSGSIWICLHVALVQLVYTKLQGVPMDDGPCHIPSSSCASHIPIPGSHPDGTAGAVGCSWEAHGLCHQLVSPRKAPFGLALCLKPCLPPVPAATRSSWCAAPAPVCTGAEDVPFWELISKGKKG